MPMSAVGSLVFGNQVKVKPAETDEQKSQRVQKAMYRKLRSLSPWNIFVRERMGIAGPLSKEQYTQRMKTLSHEWKHNLTEEDKQPFRIQAQHEQKIREDLEQTPLPVKGDGKSELELQVGKKGCSKVSVKRLALNQESFKAHDVWNSRTQLGDGD